MKFLKIGGTCKIQNEGGQFVGRNLKHYLNLFYFLLKGGMVKQKLFVEQFYIISAFKISGARH